MKDSNQIDEENWRKYLIKMYVEYWDRLQENLYFKYDSLRVIINNLSKLQEKICPDPHEKILKHTASGKASGEIEEVKKELEKEKELKWDEITGKEESVAKEREMIIGILQEVEKELTDLKVKIIRHPSGKLEFLDAENKVKLDYPKDRRVLSRGKF